MPIMVLLFVLIRNERKVIADAMEYEIIRARARGQ